MADECSGAPEESTAPDAARRDPSTAARGSVSALAGAVRYGLSEADSWALRTYAVAGTVVATFAAALVVLALPQWIAATAGGGALQRVAVGFLGLVGILLVGAAFLPLLFVHRRHRRGRPERQRRFGLAGWAFLASLYLGLVASAPPGLRSEPSGTFAPAVAALYALPQSAGVAFPIVAAALVLALEYGVSGSGE